MINYRKNKQKYKINSIGSLYVDEAKLNPNEQPIIYIGGQMEHREHVFEQTGYTKNSNHNVFTGSWMYDYSIFTRDKGSLNTATFTENLLALLREAKLNEVILVTNSYGGLIGATASKSDLISQVIAVHPPILGTPVGSSDGLIGYEHLLTKKQKLILKTIKYVINYNYGFAQDNHKGVDLRNVDLNKLLVLGNYLDLDTENNFLMLELYELIKIATGCRSDGCVPFEPGVFDQNGINYMQTDEHCNHGKSNYADYVERNVQRVLQK